MSTKGIIFDEVLSYESMEKALDILYPIYQHHGWQWSGEVPDRATIRENIERLAQNLIDSDSRYISTGRLLVYWSEHDTISVSLDVASFDLTNTG